MAAPTQRQGTMEVTAKEGVEYLKSAGEDKLLKMQGLDASNGEAAEVAKDGTMAATAAEGAALLETMGGAPESRTRSGDKTTETAEEEVPAKKTKLERDGTMAATVKEAEAVVGDEELGATRAETEELKAAADADSTPSPTKTQTMEATTKEAAEILKDEEVCGTRSETEAVKTAEETPANGDKA